MHSIEACPVCGLNNTYTDGTMNICPDCGHEWSPQAGETGENQAAKVVDSNGTPLTDGDSVTVIKDLKVKGSSMVIKRGTKVRDIRLTDNTEEVDCRVDGSGIVLKTCFLKRD